MWIELKGSLVIITLATLRAAVRATMRVQVKTRPVVAVRGTVNATRDLRSC